MRDQMTSNREAELPAPTRIGSGDWLDLVGKGFRTILADPPWQQSMTAKWNRRPNRAEKLPYPTMTVDEICAMPVGELAADDCHLWLWTTNQRLEDGFRVMRAWGFKYLAPVTWEKPSGLGCWFIHRTQTMLFGYKSKCRFELGRYKPTILHAGLPSRHSAKPKESYDLIESISQTPRLELFARQKLPNWTTWGNEV